MKCNYFLILYAFLSLTSILVSIFLLFNLKLVIFQIIVFLWASVELYGLLYSGKWYAGFGVGVDEKKQVNVEHISLKPFLITFYSLLSFFCFLLPLIYE